MNEFKNALINNDMKMLKKISKTDIHTAYEYINEALGLTESVDELVSETQIHIEFFSY